MSDLIHKQQNALAQAVAAPDVLGRSRISKTTTRRARAEVEEALLAQMRIERAKQTAIAGMLAEDQVRQLATALSGDDPNLRMANDDYLRALHVAAISQLIAVGS